MIPEFLPPWWYPSRNWERHLQWPSSCLRRRARMNKGLMWSIRNAQTQDEDQPWSNKWKKRPSRWGTRKAWRIMCFPWQMPPHHSVHLTSPSETPESMAIFRTILNHFLFSLQGTYIKTLLSKTSAASFTFISSTNDGNPPIDMKVTKPKMNEPHEPLACKKNSSPCCSAIFKT
mgnify:CR=1 FL=1